MKQLTPQRDQQFKISLAIRNTEKEFGMRILALEIAFGGTGVSNV
jgi:hypothetical protein